MLRLLFRTDNAAWGNIRSWRTCRTGRRVCHSRMPTSAPGHAAARPAPGGAPSLAAALLATGGAAARVLNSGTRPPGVLAVPAAAAAAVAALGGFGAPPQRVPAAAPAAVLGASAALPQHAAAGRAAPRRCDARRRASIASCATSPAPAQATCRCAWACPPSHVVQVVVTLPHGSSFQLPAGTKQAALSLQCFKMICPFSHAGSLPREHAHAEGVDASAEVSSASGTCGRHAALQPCAKAARRCPQQGQWATKGRGIRQQHPQPLASSQVEFEAPQPLLWCQDAPPLAVSGKEHSRHASR